MRHFKKVIVLSGCLGILCFAFQNCSQGFTSIQSEASQASSDYGGGSGGGGSGSPVSPVSPGPVSGLDTQQIPITSLQSVDSVKILIAVDDYYGEPTASKALVLAKISELLQGLKGKHAVIGLITAGTYNYLPAAQFFVPDNGATSIDLTKPLPKMDLVNYSPGTYSYIPGQTAPNFDALVPLLKRQILSQSNVVPMPTTVYTINPENTDADLALVSQQIQADLARFNTDGRRSSLCLLSRFFGDDSPNSFFKTTDAVSALLLSDADDSSTIANDCLKQSNQVQTVVRSRAFTGQQKMAYYRYNNAQNISISAYVAAATSDWVLSAACSAKDLAVIQAQYPGTFISCQYINYPMTLSSVAVSYTDDDLCVMPFTLNGANYKNAADYFHHLSPTATDACVTGSFTYSTLAVTPATSANNSSYYFITDLQSLQTQNVPLGLAGIVKTRFPAATINSVIHFANEGCALPMYQTYAPKIASLPTLIPNATTSSLCGNGYVTAFAKTSGTSGGTQKKITVSLTRNSNQIVAGVYVQKNSGQTILLPSYSITYQGSNMTVLSPLFEIGDTLLVQYKPF